MLAPQALDFAKNFLAPFPSSRCLVLKTALVNTLNPYTGIGVEQLMNIMMKFLRLFWELLGLNLTVVVQKGEDPVDG